MRKYHLALVLLTGLAFAPAKASPLTITLDSPTLAGLPGDILSFSGTITNTSADTVFLNADSFSLAVFAPSVIDDSPFFLNAPLSLGPSGSSGDIGLFNIAIPNPFAPGNYGGTFNILGGADANAQDVVGTADFTVQVEQASSVPEPSAAMLLAVALLLLPVAKRPSRASRS